MSDFYTFKTDDPLKVDVERICAENTDAIALLVSGGENQLLLINDTLLTKPFVNKFKVCGCNLDSAWGYKYVFPYCLRPETVSFVLDNVRGQSAQFLRGFRAMVCQDVKAELDVIKMTMDYEPQFKVNVHRLIVAESDKHAV